MPIDLRAQSIRLRRPACGGLPTFLAVIGLAATIAGAPVRAQTLPIGIESYFFALNPVTNKLYVSDTPCSVIDVAAKTVTNLPNTSSYYPMVVNSVTNKIYFSNNFALGLSVIDGATNAVSLINLGGVAPIAYAVNPVTNRIYAVINSNPGATFVIDGATNAILANLPTGNSPSALDIDPVTNKIYVASGEAKLVTVIDGATNAVTDIPLNVQTPAGTVLVNSATNQVYLSTFPISVLNGATNAVTTFSTPVPSGNGYSALALNPVTNTLYLSTTAAATAPGALIEFNGFTGASTVIPVGVDPDAIAVNSATNTIMVGNYIDNTLTVINGATNAVTTTPSPGGPAGLAVDPGTNQFFVLSSVGSVTFIAGPAGTPVTPPAFTTLPQNQSASAGQAVTFTGSASGSPAYQWLFNGTAIAGATSTSLTVNNASAASAGTYTLVATNGGGSTIANATLAVAVASAPAFTAQPSPQTVVSGTTVVFNSVASGSPAPSYQWKLNGNAISGAANSRLVITGATAANAGSYTCVASNSQGAATSTAATLAFLSTTNVGRLINLSVNTTAGKSQVLTVGFVSGGSGTTGSENVLIRATGPALAAFGVAGTLADPTLAVLSGQTIVGSNDNWGAPTSNQAAVTAADNATGAFALSNPASLDAALVTPLNAGGYTVQISGNTAASGTTLAEVYDTTPAASYTLSSPRLINVSSNNLIAANSSMTAGFVVGGTTAKTVLIRATGPALAVLGVQGTMPDPQLALHTTVNGQDTVLASNAGWGGDPQITATDTAVGAFTLTNALSKDSVVLVTLAPGAYTAVASSVTGTAGIALIEVYEVP